MKKSLLLIASVALLLVGCAKETNVSDVKDGEMITASFTAQMQSAPQTKAVTDGEGIEANRCVMEIYYQGVLYAREVKSVSNMKATFTPRLVSNRTYDVLFWADCGEENLADKYYTTNAEGLGLQAVEMKAPSYTANDDARDAFFANERVEVLQQVSNKEFQLKRPFSQVNIITTDAAIITNANLYPDGVKMVYTAPTKFNLLTGELSVEKELTVTGAPYEEFNKNSTALTLEMDYLFAAKEKSTLDIAFEASKTGEATVTKHSFTNIPVQRNYRTNIKGALLTTTGDWTATIVPDWSQPDEEVNFVEAGSVAAANEAFANGATSVKITSVGEETTLYLPQTTKEVTIDFTNPSVAVTVQYGPAPTKAVVEKPATVNIATNDVTKFVVTGISNIVWLAGNQAALANALNNAAAGQTVALANDITMTENWVSVSRGSNTPNFDGRNHAIINMTIKTQEDSYVGLFRTIQNHVTLQNVTFKNAKLLIPESIGNNARGGVLVGHMYPSDVINCHVEGATVVGCQKLGGLIGYIEGDAANATVTVKDCSVKDVNISSNRSGNYFEHGVGGFIGHLSLSQAHLVTIENNSVENITITGNKPMEKYSSDFLQLVPHVFIGNACQNCTCSTAAAGDHKIILNNNKILGTNTILPTCIYSSEYFGWAGNAEERPAWKGGIYIDGEEWTPNYPIKNVSTGKGYATLDAAVAALQQGETLEIWEAGEYTVQTLSAPANSIIDAKVEGVVFNRTAGGSVTSYGKATPVTVKNLTWNLGSDNYQYFNCKVENCTINGRPSIHTFASFKDCKLINTYASDYCVTTYGSPCTFENCTFSSQGKFVNVYGESQSSSKEVTAINCKFVNLKQSVNKAAFNIKGNADGQIQHTHVVIDNCTTEGLFPDHTTTDGNAIFFDGGLIMFDDPAWEADVYAVVDGVTYYPYFTMDANGNYSVKNAMGLKMAIKHWNALKVSGEKSITLADGTYNASDMAIFQNYANKSLLIKAENEKQAVITPAGSKQLIFVVAGMSKTYAGHITIDGIKFDFSNASNKDIESDVISISDATGTNLPADEKALYSGTYHYGHDITVKNCEIIGLGINNKLSSVVRTENQNAYNVKIQNCVIDKIGYVLTSKITTLAEVSGCTITDSKCVINNTVDGTEYKVFGNTISSYNDYCIRVNFGPLTVSNNEFNCTYSGMETEAGVVVLRGSTGNKATITGNTFTKASAAMNDVYCITSWEIDNGYVTKTIPANTGIKDISKLSELEL